MKKRNANQNQVRYKFTPGIMIIIKKDNKGGKDVEKGETSCTVSGNVNLSSHHAKLYRGSSKS
jgi:hypothetical protein